MKREYINQLIGLLYPDGIKCIVCGREMHKNRYGLCEACKFELNDNYCLRCGRHKVGIGDYCGECASQSLNFEEARSAVNYDDSAKKVVRRLKYGKAKYLARHIAEYLLDVLVSTDWQFDCFTFVPSDKKRRKSRGYNQAELIAIELAAKTTTPCRELIKKTRATPNQARLTKAERETNLKGAFEATADIPGAVVLIDDVMTTGSTANECAKVLKKAGANIVYVLTFASVPERPVTDASGQNIRQFRTE